jgi:hypothetical protein
MTVYLGDSGQIELQRKSGAPMRVQISPGDVSVEKRRFSVDQDIQGTLITGDQVDIVKVDNTILELIDGHNYRDWRGFVYIDIMGGIRLYPTFESAIIGNRDEALELVIPGTPQDVLIQTRNAQFNHVAQVKSFEFTTERETVDTTALGEQFRRQYDAGLISGQGRLDCFWDYQATLCDPDACNGIVEFPMYLAQLCIRLTQGADFFGRFYIYTPGGEDARASENSVWYEAECIVTNVTVTVEPTAAIESSIDFVTTETIKLLTGIPPSFLLKEDSTLLLQEDGSRIILAGAD